MPLLLSEETKRASYVHIRFMVMGGLLVGKSWPRVAYNAWIFIVNTIFFGMLCYSVYYFKDDVDKQAVSVYFIALISDVLLASLLGCVKSKELHNLFEEANLYYDYKSPLMSKFLEEHTKKRIEKIKMRGKIFVFVSCAINFNLILTSVAQKMVFQERHLYLYPIWVPSAFDMDMVLVNGIIYVYQVITSVYLSFTCIAGLCVNFTKTYNIASHANVLNHALKNIEPRAEEMATAEGELNPDAGNKEEVMKAAIVRAVSMCAQHHTIIIRYFNESNAVTELSNMIIFSSGLVLLICTGFAITSDNLGFLITFCGITLIQLVYLFHICWLTEKLVEEGLSVNTTVYDLDWLRLPKECWSTLRLMLLRSQIPLVMKTSFGQSIDLAGYMSLVNAAYSYFNMMMVSARSE